MTVDRTILRNYNVDMKTRLVQIGNSKGVRIPKPYLAESNLTDEVELEVRPHQIIIRSTSKPRQGWEDALRKMVKRGGEGLLDPEAPTEWEKTEWQWK